MVIGSHDFTLLTKLSNKFTLLKSSSVMVVICAHVPMSLRARTSVPDLWSENKGNEKKWIWVDEHADWDSWMAS